MMKNKISVALCEYLYNCFGLAALIHDGMVIGFIKEMEEN